VGTAGKPIPIPDEEIAALQTIIASGLPVEPWDYLPEGELVQIEQGLSAACAACWSVGRTHGDWL